MKKMSKKLVALLMAMAMLITMLPLNALTALAEDEEDEFVDTTTQWTQVAKTDFSNASGTSWTEDVTANDNRINSYTYAIVSSRWRWPGGTYFWDYNNVAAGNNKTLSWRMGTYLDGDTSNNNAWRNKSSVQANRLSFDSSANYNDSNKGRLNNSFNGNGTMVNDGYMYLSGWTGDGATPITETSEFKIELDFYPTTTTVSNDQMAFLTLGNGTACTKQTDDKTSANYVFAQMASGQAYVGGTSHSLDYSNSNSDVHDTSLDTSVGNNGSKNQLIAGKKYTYVVSYSHNYLRAYVVDMNGDVQRNLLGIKTAINPADIHTIALGDDNNGEYLKGMTYKEIRFYSGTSGATVVPTDAKRDKYLFAYFTGNNEAGEQLRFGLSDDLQNYEVLKGGNPISNYSVNELKTMTQNNTYPAGYTQSFAATGHIRDPYVFRDQNGGYYVLATDADIEANGFQNDSRLTVWHVDNLTDIDTAQPWSIEVTSLMNKYYMQDYANYHTGATSGQVIRAWAPQAIWDPYEGKYMLYFGCTNNWWTDGTVMYYTYTSDFKTFTDAKPLLKTHTDSIDGDITFDGELYYLYFKDEFNKKVAYATADRPNGPYSGFNYVTSTNTSAFEGPQVLRNAVSGNYYLLVDGYGYDASSSPNNWYETQFVLFASNDLSNFSYTNLNTGYNINHTLPRHASAVAITTEEYNALANKYGKQTFDGTGLTTENENANDNLIARYFTTSDAAQDASGHNNELNVYNGLAAKAFEITSSNASAAVLADLYSDKNNIATAYFNGSGNSGAKTGHYATVKSPSTAFADLNLKDGITIAWYAYTTTSGWNRMFDWSTAATGSGGDSSNFLYAATNTNLGVDYNGTKTEITDYANTASTGMWHKYQVNITENYVSYFVDDGLLMTTYNAANIVKRGSPMRTTSVCTAWLNSLKSGTFNIGASTYSSDGLFSGNIADFRIYKKAYSPADISNALQAMDSDVQEEDIDDVSRVYYDPMEDMDTTGDGNNDKTTYGSPLSITDPNMIATEEPDEQGNVDPAFLAPIMGTVYSTGAASTNSKYLYNGASTNTGYTISTWFNPGSSIDTNTTVFAIGSSGTDTLELMEDGKLYFNYGGSYINMTGVFGDKGLPTDTWSHIEIQIVPNNGYDIVYVYVNGLRTAKIDTFLSKDPQALDPTKSIHAFMARANTKVFYGVTNSGKTNNGGAYADDFSIYLGAVNPKEIYHRDSDQHAETLIFVAMDEYAKKMATITQDPDTVFTNMAPAYDAYDASTRYIDSYKYGDKINPQTGNPLTEAEHHAQLVQLFDDLRDANEEMQEYSEPKTIEGLTVGDTGVSNAIAPAYTQNLISVPSLSETKQQEGGQGSGIGSEKALGMIISGPIVWLWDGETELTAPINGGVYTTNRTNVNYYANALYVAQSGDHYYAESGAYDEYETRNCEVTLKNPWRMKRNTSLINWYYDDADTSQIDYRHGEDSNSTPYYKMSDGVWDYGSNVLYYAPNSTTQANLAKTDKATRTFKVTTNPHYGFTQGWKYWTNFWQSDEPQHWLNYKVTDPGTVTVINYVPVKAALTDSTRMDKLSKVIKYSPESMKTLLNAYDDLTGQEYIGYASQVNELAATIEQEVLALEDVDLDAIEAKANYDDLLEVVKNNGIEKSDQTRFYEAVKNNDKVMVEKDASGNYVDVASGAKYTTSSIRSYINAYEAVERHFTNLNPFGVNDPYATSQKQVDRLAKNIAAARADLVEAADYTNAEEVAASNSAYTIARDTNNGVPNGDQLYTYDAWVDFAEPYEEAKSWAEKSTAYKEDTEKYKVDYVASKVIDGQNLSYGPYVAYLKDGTLANVDNVPTASNPIDRYEFCGVFYDTADDAAAGKVSPFEEGMFVVIGGTTYDVTGYRYYPSVPDTTKYSDRQQSILDSAENTENAYDDLDTVDIADAYRNFEDVKAIALAERDTPGKYNADGIAAINTAIATAEAAINKNLTAEEQVLYKELTDKATTTTFVRNTGLKETDTVTADLLSAVNGINSNSDAYYCEYTATLTVSKDGDQVGASTTQTKKYGEQFDLGTSVASNETVVWSATFTDADGEVTGSSKIKGDSNVKLVADRNVEVTADITVKDNDDSAPYTYNIYNANHKLVGIVYDTAGPDEVDKTKFDAYRDAMAIPFYTFTGWVTNHPEGKVITVGGEYTITTELREYSVVDGTLNATDAVVEAGKTKIRYDRFATLNYTGSDNFYAWATVDAQNKFSIASYNRQYVFTTYVSENFVPVIKVGDSYKFKTANGDVTLEDATFESEPDSKFAKPTAAYYKAKLDEKAPFVAIVGTVILTEEGKSRAYIRATEPASCTKKAKAYGIRFDKAGGTNWTTSAITNILDSGMYSVTLKETTVGNFSAYINYEMTYTFDGTLYDGSLNDEQGASASSTLNVTDYSQAEHV